MRYTKEDLQKVTKKDIRNNWGDVMELLEKLMENKHSTDVAAYLLPPSKSQLLFGQRYDWKLNIKFKNYEHSILNDWFLIFIFQEFTLTIR